MTETAQNIAPDEQQAYQSLLAKAFAVARGFNGSESSLERVVDAFNAADNFVLEKTGSRDMTAREELETELAGVSGFDRKSIGQMFLEVTLPFYKSLSQDIFEKLRAGGAAIVETGAVFVKTDKGEINAPGSGQNKFEIKTQPRLAWLVEDLREIGIFTDDLVIHKGKVDENMVRQKPYVVVDIPRLNKQIAVCDQISEITFVSSEILDPRVYENCSKETLKSLPQITAVELYNRDHWRQNIEAVLRGDAPKPKQDVQKVAANPPKRPFPLTVAIIMESVHAHHQATGKWPTEMTGEISYGSLKGDTWATINAAIRIRRRGLQEGNLPEEVKGLASLLEWKKLAVSHVSPTKKLTVAMIMESVHAHHKATGKWPGQKTGEILYGSLKGEDWAHVDNALRTRGRGLAEESHLLGEEVKGLTSLLEWKKLTVSNLSPTKKLTVAVIMESVAAHHQTTGKWPTEMTGEILYGPLKGEDWKNISRLIGVRGRGLNKENLPEEVKGVTSLLEWKKLAVSNLSPTKKLTVAIIVESAQAHYDATGKWPTQTTGEILYGPLKGEDWGTTIDSAISGRIRRLEEENLPEEVKGLTSLLEWKKLTVSNLSATKKLTVAMIVESVEAHHQETGKWPTQRTGPVLYGPLKGDEWVNIDAAIRNRRRGLKEENLPEEVKGIRGLLLEWEKNHRPAAPPQASAAVPEPGI